MKVSFLNTKTWDLLILSARCLIAFIFLSYGIGKITGNQFGNLTETELATPIKDLSLFKVSWFLFEHEPFRSFIGICQILASLLLLYNRTAILGALMFIPIVLNILIIDLTVMPPSFRLSFTFRLSFYLILLALILHHYQEKIVSAWKTITNDVSLKHEHPRWRFILVPVIMILLESMSGVLQFIYVLATHPEHIKKLF